MNLGRVQAISGIVFAVFLVLHLATTASAIGGPAAYDATLRSTRVFYRPAELVILAAAAVHMICAAIQIARRRRQARVEVPLARRLHRWSGYVLLFAIAGHVFATRYMPSGTADFSYLAYSVLGWSIFIDPYYFILGTAGALHLVLGIAIAAKRLNRGTLIAAGVAALVVIVGVAGIIGYSKRADRSRFAEFQAAYRRFMPFLMPIRAKD